jgi:hypothetical protein
MNKQNITEDELAEIRAIAKRKNITKEELAAIGEAEISISVRKDNIKNYLLETVKLEKQLSHNLQEKYGTVSVNIEDGTIQK